MTIVSRAVAVAFASVLLMGTAMAQNQAPPASPAPAAPTAAPAPKMKKPRSTASLECSKEADAKNVHGKERKKFMSDCKKNAATTTPKQ
jgi:psiF repeat